MHLELPAGQADVVLHRQLTQRGGDDLPAKTQEFRQLRVRHGYGGAVGPIQMIQNPANDLLIQRVMFRTRHGKMNVPKRRKDGCEYGLHETRTLRFHPQVIHK